MFSILSVPKPHTLIPIIPDVQYLRGLTIREMKNALIQLRQTPPQDAVHHRVPQPFPLKGCLKGFLSIVNYGCLGRDTQSPTGPFVGLTSWDLRVYHGVTEPTNGGFQLSCFRPREYENEHYYMVPRSLQVYHSPKLSKLQIALFP